MKAEKKQWLTPQATEIEVNTGPAAAANETLASNTGPLGGS
jgi:hypothetical protein